MTLFLLHIAKHIRLRSLTNIHDGGGRHVTHGRREKKERVEALAGYHLWFWAASVMANQDVEDCETAELAQKHSHRLDSERCRNTQRQTVVPLI